MPESDAKDVVNLTPSPLGGTTTAPSPSASGPFPVVGVGASAGGLDAFIRLLRHLPPNAGLAVLFVQHLDPTRGSLLVEILARETGWAVREASDGTRIDVNQVYVIPPDTRMSVTAGVIRLQARGERAAAHLPVDFLFRSLAAEYGSRSVAVVLSGGGADGTAGMGDVRESGGVTFAQDEASAGQSGMPWSAAGVADAILTPEGIGAALGRLVGRGEIGPTGESQAGADAGPDGDEELTPLFALLRARRGVDFTHYKQNTIRRRVQRRLTIRELTGVDDLVRVARDEPTELAAVYRDLLIGVTRFFRDPAAFERFRQNAIPAMIRDRSPAAPLRVWVPGCSTGEEAYSLAILLSEAFGESGGDPPVKILATDVNEESLARARAGVYPDGIAECVSPERLRRYFRKVDGGYRVSPVIRDLCVFARHDLTADPPFARMDLVSCRNVLIYLGVALQRRIVPRFHYALRPGGFLFLGPAEVIGPFADLFATADRDAGLYTRTLTPARFPLGLSGPSWGRAPAATAPPAGATSDAVGLADVQREADRILARYAPPGLLIDDNLTVLQFRGNTDPYLSHPSGAASLALLRMAREGLLPALGDAITSARAGGVAVTRPGVRVSDGDREQTVTVRVTPLAAGGQDLRCYLVVFENEAAGTVPSPPPPVPDSEGLAERVTQLRAELDASREHQQAVAEEYEATTEELKSANEEILASNEELQSTNEELQTAKEELQSTNEELQTVNEELMSRNREVGRANDDLRSLLLGVNVPVVVVGRDLCVRRLTAQAEEVFGLSPSDVGRSLRDLRPRLVGADLGGTVGRVIETLEVAAFETQDRAGHWFSVRVRPYETLEHRIDGAVVTAIDVDALKRGEAERRDLEVRMFQAQKLESLGVMAGGIAHDLNNLLTPLIGYAELARDSLPEGSPARGPLEEVGRTTRVAAALVKQILAYSGKSRREIRTTDLSGLIRDFGGLLERAVGTRALLTYDLAAGPLPVEADVAQISQVVMNLVANAAEAMGPGGGTVTVRTEAIRADRAALASPYFESEDLPEGEYAVLEVSDTGSGMTPETLGKLFDPFYTTKFTGRGLGLAAVLGIVRGHGGSIRVRSEPGRGSTVRVLLPRSERSPPEPAAAAPSAPPVRPGSGTILVVDDEPMVRRFIATMLTGAGYTVKEASDGREAVGTFHILAPDLLAVLLDLTMPGLSGREAAAEMRAINRSVPIVGMSGYSSEGSAGGDTGPPFEGFLHKPFAPGALLGELRRVLGAGADRRGTTE